MPNDSRAELSDEMPSIAVVVPCYRERDQIMDVLPNIGPEVQWIFVIDDACPDGTGEFVAEQTKDPRVNVTRNDQNMGVGGATLAGYRKAVAAGADIIVKLDGDGQMDPALIPDLVRPVRNGLADYTKGNRLHRADAARGMPLVRLFGNISLTFMSKISSGYWDIMDPTNGYTAIHAKVANELIDQELAHGYFFESDLLFRLGGLNAVVVDVPMQAKYGDEESSLSIRRVFMSFLLGHLGNAYRRIFDTYFVRDPGIATIELVLGKLLLLFGAIFGGYHWWLSVDTGIPATAGTVIIAAVPIILGAQLLLAFINADTRRVPNVPLHLSLPALPKQSATKPR